MISYLKGIIQYKGLNSIEILCDNVGYEVFINENTYSQIHIDDEIEIYIEHHKTEASDDLYGFLNRNDKSVFKMLLSVSGIGPRTALAIFNAGNGEQIMSAVSRADTDFFKKAKGIGTKVAQRIIIDLKSKAENLSDLDLKEKSYNKSVWEALKSMGFTRSEISNALTNIPKDVQSEDKIISYALKNLSKYE